MLGKIEREVSNQELAAKLEMALKAEDLRAQLLGAVIDNYSSVLVQKDNVDSKISVLSRTISEIDQIVAETMAELEGQPETATEATLVDLSNKYGEPYEKAQADIPPLITQQEEFSQIVDKHSALVSLLLDSEIKTTAVSLNGERLPINTSESENAILLTNTVESNVLKIVLISQEQIALEAIDIYGSMDMRDQNKQTLVSESEEISAHLRNPAWILKNPVQSAKYINRRKEINNELHQIQVDEERVSVRLREIESAVKEHQMLSEKIGQFYSQSGGVELIQATDAVEEPTPISVVEEVVEIETKQTVRPDIAILQILESTVPKPVETLSPTDTQKMEIVKAKAIRADWASVFGLSIIENMSPDEYNNFVQKYRNAIATLVFSKKLDADPEIQHYRQVRVEFATANGAKMNYKDALDFIGLVVRVKHLRVAYREPEPVARIIALVYKQTTGTFRDHGEFIDLANQIMHSEEYDKELYLNEIIDILLLDESDGQQEISTEESSPESDPQSPVVPTENIKTVTSTIKIDQTERDTAIQNKANGIINAAIEFFNDRAAGKNMPYHFPISLETTLSKEQANQLLGGAADLRHRGYNRDYIENRPSLDIFDLIVLYIGKKHDVLFDNRRTMKKLIPVIREVYESDYLTDEAKK